MVEAEKPQRHAGWAAGLLLANLGFGTAGAAVSSLRISALGSMSIAFTAAGLTSLAWLALSGKLTRDFSWKTGAAIALAYSSQNLLYFVSLRLAPPGPAAAMHLASPLLLLLYFVIRGQRALGTREVAIGVLVVAGASMASVTGTADSLGSLWWLGYLFAVLSAVCVGVLLLVVSTVRTSGQLLTYTVMYQLFSGVMVSPALILETPATREVLILVAIGIFIYSPGNLLVFHAVPRLGAVAVGAFCLSEAVFTALMASILFHRPFSLWQAVAIALIVGAALLEITRPKRAVGTPVQVPPVRP